MLIPFKTSAPRYYYPIGTIALIAANVILYRVTGPVQIEQAWLLQFGKIDPVQWITSAFNHASSAHLIGNMLFLFLFGQVVEGRMGFAKFLPLYLAMAAAEGAVTQVLMLGAGPVMPGYGALGASGAIYGLLVIAIFWAPKAEVSILFVWFGHARSARVFEWPLRAFLGAYVALDLLAAIFSGFAMSTPVLHLIGAAAGLAPAIWLPRTGKIYLGDWEGILHHGFNLVMEKKEPPAVEPERTPAPPAPTVVPVKRNLPSADPLELA